MCPSKPAKIWFIFPGMGSQWHGMGRALQQQVIPFQSSIAKSHLALQKQNFDLLGLIGSSDPDVYKDPLNAFVGICAIQVRVYEKCIRLFEMTDDNLIA